MTQKDFTHLPQQSEQNMREIQSPKQQTSSGRKLTLTIIILILLSIAGYNYLAIQSKPDFQARLEKEVAQYKKVQIQQQKQRIDELEQMLSKTEEQGLSCKITLSSKSKQRVSYGQPRPKNSSMKAVVIEKKNAPTGQSICAITNGVNIITQKTILTAKNFLNQESVSKWIVFIGLIDQVGNDVVKRLQSQLSQINVIRVGEVRVDANYQFITTYTKTCSSVVYLQNTFNVNPNRAKAVVDEIAKLKGQNMHGYVGFTQTAEGESGLRKLQDLRHVDISQIKEQKINEYIYMFDAALLNVITPLNFVHFAKYTLQQILINPILALTQKSKQLVPVKGNFHFFDEAVVQFKQFQFIQPETASTCFVAYPSKPDVFDVKEIASYVKSINQINNKEKGSVVIISVPYDFNHQSSLFEAYEQLVKLTKGNSNIRVKLKIYNKKAVSSITVYEAAHTYCGKSSNMVTSRLSVQVSKQFFTLFHGSSSEKYRFYYSDNESNLNTASQLKKEVQSSQERFSIQKYLSILSLMQIFNTQFFKMVNLWVLKSDEDEFFESQASFVMPLVEMAGEQILGISNLFTVSGRRIPTDEEQIQMRQLQKYSRWPKMQNNILRPIAYNSLTNMDLRKGNLNQIPKIIHQVWFKDEEIPESIQVLQSSIQQVNRDFEYRLWKKQNLTSYNFPMSYALVARTLEYEWAYEKSYHAWVQALISYQILYNHGGIYIDVNAEANKPLDPYLKYELFFAGFETHSELYSSPVSVGRQIIGAKRFSYHMRFILSELITEQGLNYNCADLEQVVGGGVVRLSLTDDQLFTAVGFGFHLFNYDPFNLKNFPCKSANVPCNQFQQAYIRIHDIS